MARPRAHNRTDRQRIRGQPGHRDVPHAQHWFSGRLGCFKRSGSPVIFHTYAVPLCYVLYSVSCGSYMRKTMSEVYARASSARHRQRSRHAHPRSPHCTPACPPRRAHPHPRRRASAAAPLMHNSILRLFAATLALTHHNTHIPSHTDRCHASLTPSACARRTSSEPKWSERPDRTARLSE